MLLSEGTPHWICDVIRTSVTPAGSDWLWRMENVFIGTALIRGREYPLLLSNGDRRQHLFIVGQTGVGKTTLMQSLVAQDIQAGEGTCFIDPHGDGALTVLKAVPKNRVDDVIFLNPMDFNRPLAINPFYRVPRDSRPLVADNITSVFRHVFKIDEASAPRLLYLLYAAVAALLDAPDKFRPTFVAIPKVIARGEYQNQIIAHIKDPEIRRMWREEISRWSDRFYTEAVASVQNKLQPFVSNPFIRNILGQWHPTVDFSFIVKNRQILIVRLSKGMMGEGPASILGSLVFSGFQQAAMGRAAIEESQRHNFYLHADEFHSFTTNAFASVLSEARKYGLCLSIGGQYLSQASDKVLDAIFGNVGNIICFRVSSEDADQMAATIGYFHPRVLRDLHRGQICARFTSAGQIRQACLAKTTARASWSMRILRISWINPDGGSDAIGKLLKQPSISGWLSHKKTPDRSGVFFSLFLSIAE